MAFSRLSTAVVCTMVATSRADCSNAQWTQAYSPDACHMEGPTAVVKCLGKSGSQCGTRMESGSNVGIGLHTMTIKAAPGPGVVSTFYMSTNGGLYDKSCTQPWVELDFEIMGNQAGSESKIWTNMLQGTCQEHWAWITVPFDVSADYHTYAFDITTDSISWLVDGVAYRTVATDGFPDAHAAAQSSSFKEFISVWGKSSAEAGEGIPEFRNALGVLDSNTNAFPLIVDYQRPSSSVVPAPAPAVVAAPAPAGGAATCVGGPALWGDCSARHCCGDGATCYEKDAHFAQCRQSCTPGTHDDDELKYRIPWSCHVLTPAVRR
mmetsp:Transcript_103900/g.334849  ORF Transcript_103900/g.334849 Transcript_103900/m.334849 type:complete len:321 (-) Transcript_103900:460-1422(-)